MHWKTFFFLLLLAALAYGAVRLIRGPGQSYFQSSLIAIDTSRVTAVSILPPADPKGEFFLKREGKTWIASQGNRSVKALPAAVGALLGKLVLLEAYEIVASGEKSWEEYGLGDVQGLRVRVFQNGAQLEDFVVGAERMGKDSLPFTWVRIWGEEEVFSVPGSLKGLWPGFGAFRSMVLLSLDPEKVKSVQWEPAGLDTAYLFTDSLRPYLSELQSLAGLAFADAFDPVSMSASLQGRLIFSGSEWDSPVEVRYYFDTLWEMPFIFYSTQNPDNYFLSDSVGLYSRLVLPVYSLPGGPPRDSLSQ